MPNPYPLAKVDPNDPGQGDLDTSAWSVLHGIGDDDQESAGLIMQHPSGQYYYTAPIPSQQHDHFALRAAVQQGWKIAGIYHTHPGNDADGQLFSPDDLQMASQLKVPSYIKFMKDGAIRKYIPGQTASSNQPAEGNKFIRKVASGDPVDSAGIQARLQMLQQKAQQVAQQSTPPPAGS